MILKDEKRTSNASTFYILFPFFFFFSNTYKIICCYLYKKSIWGGVSAFFSPSHHIEILRSIRGFFVVAATGNGTTVPQRGHLGFPLEISTQSRQLGQPAANVADDFSSSSKSPSLIEDEEFEGGDDDDFDRDIERFLMVSFSALSRANFTLSRVQTLW